MDSSHYWRRSTSFCLSLMVFMFVLLDRAFAQADNDMFEHREVIRGTAISFTPHFRDATLEPWELDLSGSVGAPSVWYEWVAPQAGLVSLRSTPFLPGSTLTASLFKRDAQSKLVPAVLLEPYIWSVSGGVTYYLQVGAGYYSDPRRELGLSLRFAPLPLPANDQIDRALVLTGEDIHFQASTVGALNDATEVGGGSTLVTWWRWSAKEAGVLTVTNDNDSVAIYDSSLQPPNNPFVRSKPVLAKSVAYIAARSADWETMEGHLKFSPYVTPVGIKEGIVLPKPGQIEFGFAGVRAGDIVTNISVYMDGELGLPDLIATADSLRPVKTPYLYPGTYQIQAHLWCSSGREYYMKKTRVVVGLAGDRFSTPYDLPGDVHQYELTSFGAHQDTGEPENAAVWWRWIAPATGPMYVDPPIFNLWEGTNLVSLKPVTRMLFVAGKEYRFSLPAGIPPTQVTFSYFRNPGAEDFFATRRVVQSLPFADKVHLSDATPEPGEPTIDGIGPVSTIWYTVTPSVDGALIIEGDSPPGLEISSIRVFRGDSLAGLEAVHEVAKRPLAYQVKAGNTYHIQVAEIYSHDGSDRFVSLKMGIKPVALNDSFDHATELKSEHIASLEINLENCDLDPAEPSLGFSDMQWRTAWWHWVAPRDGQLALSLRDAAGTTNGPLAGLDVFRGDALSNLVSLIPLKPTHGTQLFEVTGGERYWLRLSTVDSNRYTQVPPYFMMGLDFSDLKIVPQGPLPTAIADAPLIKLAGTFQNSGPAPAQVFIWEAGSTVRGPSSHGSVKRVGEIAGFDGAFDLRVLGPGVHYLLAILQDSEGFKHFSNVQLIRLRPDHDDFEGAIPLSQPSSFTSSPLSGATVESGESLSGLYQNSRSIWYSWTPVVTNTVKVTAWTWDYARVVHPLTLAVYSNAPNGKPVMLKFGSAKEAAFLSWNPTLGRKYWFQVIDEGSPVGSTETGSRSSLQVEQPLSFTWGAEGPNRLLTEGQEIALSMSSPYPPSQFAQATITVNNQTWDVKGDPQMRAVIGFLEPGFYAVRGDFRLIGVNQPGAISGTMTVYALNSSAANADIIESLPDQRIVPFKYVILGNDRFLHHWYQLVAPIDGVLTVFVERIGEQAGVEELHMACYQQSAGSGALTLIKPLESSSGFIPFTWAVTNQQTCLIDMYGLGSMTNRVSFSVVERPANRYFTNAVPWLYPVNSNVVVNVAGTTKSTPIPEPRVAWYSWTALEDGAAILYGGMILQGDTEASLQTVAQNTVGQVHAGQRYILKLWAGDKPQVPATLQFFPRPINDRLEGRIRLPAERYTTFSGYDAGSILDPWAVAQLWSANESHFLYWSWVAPADGRVKWSRLDQRPSPSLHVGTLNGSGETSFVAWGEFSCAFDAKANIEYVLVNHGSGQSTNIPFNLFFESQPPNDQSTNATPLVGPKWEVKGWNTLAHREYMETLHDEKFGGRSVWYSWRAPWSGDVSLKLTTAKMNPIIAVYEGEGDRFSELSPVVSASAYQASTTSFHAVGAKRYRIVVDDWYGIGDDFTLAGTLKLGDTPPHIEIIDQNTTAMRLRVVGLGGRRGMIRVSADLFEWTPTNEIPEGLDTWEFSVDSSTSPSLFIRCDLP